MTMVEEERRGFVGWLRSLFRPRPRYDAIPEPPVGYASDVEVMERRDPDEPLSVPSTGDCYRFTVEYHVTWSATGMTRDALRDRISTHSASVKHDLVDRIWPVGRDFEPHDAVGAEKRMNEVLGSGWCYGVRGEVACAVRVRVTCDERIREKQLSYYEQLVGMDSQHMLNLRRLGHVKVELGEWRTLIEDFGEALTVVHAARLVDEDVSTVLKSLAAARKASAGDLVTVLHKATRDHLQVGLYEFAQAYDLAVRSYMQQQGLTAGTLAEAFDASATATNS
jgi:hypothetical protein